jgi:hypothetical protein
MRNRLGRRKEEQRLIRIGDQNLFRVPGSAREAGQDRRPRRDRLDSPFILANIDNRHAITDRDQVSSLSLPLEETLRGAKKRSGRPVETNLEELAERFDHRSGVQILSWQLSPR